MANKGSKKTTPAAAEAPTSSCLLLCDDVLVSYRGGKCTIQGVIDRIRVSALPAEIGPFVAYVRLSNVYRRQRLFFDLMCLSTNEKVLRINAISPKASNPLMTHTLVIPLPRFAVTDAGRYSFTASHGGAPFAQSLVVIETPQPTAAGDSDE
jgi:hypothetical protein